MHYFSQSSIFCVHPSAAAGLRQAFVNDRNGEILLYVTLPCIKETVRFPPEGPDGGGCYVRGQPAGVEPCFQQGFLARSTVDDVEGVPGKPAVAAQPNDSLTLPVHSSGDF